MVEDLLTTDAGILRFPSEEGDLVAGDVARACAVRTAGDRLTSRVAGCSSAGGDSAGNLAECIASGDKANSSDVVLQHLEMRAQKSELKSNRPLEKDDAFYQDGWPNHSQER